MINNLEYYRVFYHIAKNGSLTAAAEELAISQPAVSQSVRQLEAALGAKLFIRVPRGVKLTKEGELLYHYVARGYEQFQLGEEKLKQMLNLDLGEIHIGASDMTLQFYLLPFLEQFHEQYPGIRVVVTNAPTPETLRNLQEGKLDFGVVSTPFEKAPSLEAEAVREIEDIFVAGRKFIQYKNKMLDFQELERMPLIFLEGVTSTGSNMEKFLRENHVEIHPEFELATSGMIVQFALRNLGVGCVVRDFAREYLETGQLFELRFNKIIPKRHFCVVTDKKNPMSAAAENLLRLFSGRREER
ncbi:MAG: LysR family transcriptional regulator [Blautia sp.]|nr:LysR family transcriptional regulator [Blautia sp.]MCM1199728.1 LysR family transcriptional regulator [Bacteroides fragilis]